MAKKRIEDTPLADDFAGDVLAAINKKFKDLPNSIGYLSSANLIDKWVSTGSSILDLAISNKPNGGLGFGTIVEIFGPSATSKSLLGAHILAETQKIGGLAVLFDTEKAVGMLDFYRSIGLDVNKALYSDRLRTLEEIFASIEVIIERSVQMNKDKPIAIVVDSVMGATTLQELESDYEKDGWATTKALVLSKAMRKITSLMVGRPILLVFINQIRSKLGVTFGDATTTSGGMAIPFHSSVRLKTKTLGKLEGEVNGIKAEVGNRVQVTVVKNRLGPPGRSVSFDIYYDSGIDDEGSWLSTLKDFGVLKLNGSWYSYDFINHETGELTTHKFLSKDFRNFLNKSPEIRDAIYNEICKAMIMEYDINDLDIEVVENKQEEE